MNSDGPDQIIPTTNCTTSNPDGAITIARNDDGTGDPISVYSYFKEVSQRYPDQLALAIKRNGQYQYWNYTKYFEESCIAAKAMIKLGLERFHGVCIMGYNAPEWLIANFGAVFAGGFSAGVYTTNSPESCLHVAENCQAQIIFVENKICLDKFLSVKKNLPHLKALIQWSGEPSEVGVLSWSKFMEIGSAEDDEILQKRLSVAAINQCCTLIYTSGTTGPPKGVMITQDQLTWSGKHYKHLMELQEAEEIMLSYLPLSHLAAHLCDIYIALSVAMTVYFAPPDALKGKLVQTLVEVRPTFFAGVPRVWEKIYEKMQEASANVGSIKKMIGEWAKYQGLNYYKAMEQGRDPSTLEVMKYSAANSFVLSHIKIALGLDRAKGLLSGGAPIDTKVLEYFYSLDLPVRELYGLSECLSFCSHNHLEKQGFKIGSVGKILPFTEVTLMGVDDLREGEGEVCIRGRNVCMGYLRMPGKTDAAIDKEGWLHTGDIGWFDANEFLHITGRLKELVITAGGENIPPVLIEDVVKKELPCVSSAILVGDKRKFLTILLALKCEVDVESGRPLSQLSDGCQNWLKEAGSLAKSVEEVIGELKKEPNGAVAKAMQSGIDRYNEIHSVSHAQRIQLWAILPNDFSLPTGELNNTLKMKRSFILEKYSKLIDKIYSGNWVKVAAKK